MSLPKEKRQIEEQAKPSTKKSMERIPSSGDPYRQIMKEGETFTSSSAKGPPRLLPRIGKA